MLRWISKKYFTYEVEVQNLVDFDASKNEISGYYLPDCVHSLTSRKLVMTRERKRIINLILMSVSLTMIHICL
jgi:hypothetical protein